MARGRMVNQTIAEDEAFNGLSLEAQLVYLRTIPHLDRDGLIIGHPSALWGKVAPLMPDLLAAMPKLIEEMATAGLVIKYTVSKTQILFFKGFTKNQIGMRYEREPASTFPIPPGYKRTDHGLEPIVTPGNDQTPPPAPPTNGTVPHEDLDQLKQPAQTSGRLPADFRQTSGNPPHNRIEENRIEGEYTPAPATPTSPTPVPPPSGNSQTGDPYMDKASARFQQRQANGGRHKANRISLWPDIDAKVPAAERLPLVERLIDIHGLRAAIDTAEDDAKLADMHKLAADLYVMGFKTLADIEKVFQQFQKEWRGKTPAGRQLVTIASAMSQTPQTTPTKPPPQILTFKLWCKEKYHSDNLVAIGLPEATVRGLYEQYQQQFKQAH